jgi:polysaccharide export outer membrane protein
MTRTKLTLLLSGVFVGVMIGATEARTQPDEEQGTLEQAASATAVGASIDGGVQTPPSYVIGPGDVLGVVLWRQEGMSGDVVVRPDGKISVPLLDDVHASGLTPHQLSQLIQQTATRFVQDPNVTVIVRQINSRAVYITGRVARPGRYPLNGSTSILQLIAMAGGLAEWANEQNVVLMRPDQDQFVTHRFNYKDVIERKNLAQNIELEPGDTVIVP